MKHTCLDLKIKPELLKCNMNSHISGGRSIGKYNLWLMELAAILEGHSKICVGSISNKYCEKIILDLKQNYPNLILDYKIKDFTIYFN